MGLLRNKDDGLGGTRYRMREKLFSIGDDSWIDTEDERHAFKVNGKALRLRDTFVLEAPSGEELLKVQEKKLHIRDTMKIERGGEAAATVRKAMITPLRDRFSIELASGGEMTREGEHRRPRVLDRERRSHGRPDLQALVPGQGHLRHRGRARPGRRPDPRRGGLHRRDDERR